MALSDTIQKLAKAKAFEAYEEGAKGDLTRNIALYPDYHKPMKERPTEHAQFFGKDADTLAEKYLEAYKRKPWRHE